MITFAKEAGFDARDPATVRRIRQRHAAVARWQELATAKLEEIARGARIDATKAVLREARRCGCAELKACGKLLRARTPSTTSCVPDVST
jgi:hypothetical protein